MKSIKNNTKLTRTGKSNRKFNRKSIRKSTRTGKLNRKSIKKSLRNTKKNRKSMKGGMQSIQKIQKEEYKNLYPLNKDIPIIERDLKKKIQYVFVNSHGVVIDTHEAIAIKDPKSLLPQEGPDVNKRILTNSFCGNLLYHFKSLTHNYMSYLLNLYQEEDGLDVLWSFTQKQEEKLAEIDKILFPKKKNIFGSFDTFRQNIQ